LRLRILPTRALLACGATFGVRGKGRGGPNQEYALALAIALTGLPSIAAWRR
jgi:glycerate 2-kinase